MLLLLAVSKRRHRLLVIFRLIFCYIMQAFVLTKKTKVSDIRSEENENHSSRIPIRDRMDRVATDLFPLPLFV
jgi:hypothetical protein